jgi:hypothetical protein
VGSISLLERWPLEESLAWHHLLLQFFANIWYEIAYFLILHAFSAFDASLWLKLTGTLMKYKINMTDFP